jgi:hypothetical protein
MVQLTSFGLFRDLLCTLNYEKYSLTATLSSLLVIRKLYRAFPNEFASCKKEIIKWRVTSDKLNNHDFYKTPQSNTKIYDLLDA